MRLFERIKESKYCKVGVSRPSAYFENKNKRLDVSDLFGGREIFFSFCRLHKYMMLRLVYVLNKPIYLKVNRSENKIGTGLS